MSRHGHLGVPDPWTEGVFERGAYGPDDRTGVAATLTRADAAITVVPVRYRRRDGEQRIRAITEDWIEVRNDPAVPFGTVPPTTAFATRVRTGGDQRRIACVAADAGDALAVAVWVARVGDATALNQRIDRHAGTGSRVRGMPVVADDDVLGAFFVDEPRQCLLTGQQTRSHQIVVPYRYVDVLAADQLRDGDALRFPSIIGGLTGVVSHAAWEDHGLADVAFDAPLERVAAGRYRLESAVVDTLEDVDAGAFALAGFGA